MMIFDLKYSKISSGSCKDSYAVPKSIFPSYKVTPFFPTPQLWITPKSCGAVK